MYVSSSRAKDRMTLYTDSKEDVRDAVQRSSKKLLALDMPVARPKARHRLHRHRDHKRRLSVINRVRAAWGRLISPLHKEKHLHKEAGYER